jgi:curved DNA-binding protein CbpA
MEGQLSEHPLAELISEILEKRFSGALRVTRERVKAIVYFEAGELAYATSNLRNFRLVEYLKKRGLAAKTVEGEDSTSDFAVADALIARGLITRPALDVILAEQIADVARVLLLWTSGHWSFDSRARLTAPVQVRIPIKALLLEAARRMDLQFAASRFRNPRELISPVTDCRDHLPLSSNEGFLLSRVAGPLAVEELAAVSGLREPDAHRAVYGLVLAGVLHRELSPFAFRTSQTEGAVKSEKTSAPKSSSPLIATPPPARDPQEELKEFLDRLAQATSHYQVLDVSPAADAGEVKSAYYALARRFHPDRFHDLARTPLHARLESAFARVTQAQEILSDPDQRSAYDAKIAALKRTGNSPLGRPNVSARPADDRDGQSINPSQDMQLAEKRFKEGAAALQLGETNTAITCLSVAARIAPNQPRYRAYYGRALAAHPKTQRLAEAELQAAVKLDPANASYRLMLAGLYRNLGFPRRAIAELERALALDSKNTEARKMLQTLEANKR